MLRPTGKHRMTGQDTMALKIRLPVESPRLPEANPDAVCIRAEAL